MMPQFPQQAVPFPQQVAQFPQQVISQTTGMTYYYDLITDL